MELNNGTYIFLTKYELLLCFYNYVMYSMCFFFSIQLVHSQDRIKRKLSSNTYNLSCDMNRSIKRRPSIERVRTIFQLWLTYIQQQDYQQAMMPKLFEAILFCFTKTASMPHCHHDINFSFKETYIYTLTFISFDLF